jgi:hypothetical protein
MMFDSRSGFCAARPLPQSKPNFPTAYNTIIRSRTFEATTLIYLISQAHCENGSSSRVYP